MKRAILTALTLLAGLARPVLAQERAHAALYARTKGTDVRLALEVKIDEGLHLYHGPTVEDMSPDGAIGKPTVVKLEGDGIVWSPVRFPVPDVAEQRFDESEPPTHIRQHHGRIVLYARGRLRNDGPPPPISATISGLTCDPPEEGGQCIPYDETVEVQGEGPDGLFAAFPADLTVTGGGSAGTSPPDAIPAPPPAVPAGASATQGADPGLWLFLLSAVGWGLFTLLMPCTYPMIPITISYFTKQASQRNTGTLPLSVFYGVGIVAVFVLIGVAVGPLILTFATHPVTNLVIGLLFILFALALFGAVDLQPPAFLLSAAGKASSQGGYLGVFLMGATLVVTSFTCTAPFVGTLLAQGASSGGLGHIALGMGVFGLTMAIPFVLLSMLPSRVKAMPRSGEWMHTVKVTLGFVEIAAALKFISNVDLIWQWGWLSRELFLFLWLGLFLIAALYLLGLVRLRDEAQVGVSPGRLVAGVFFASYALYCGYGAVGNSVDPILTAIIPPYSGRIGDSAPGANRPSAAGHSIIKDDYERALQQAREDRKLLLVNFTGFTCVNCRLMEEKVFPVPVVAEALEGFIEARLHNDGGPRKDENLKLQQERTGSLATPIYVVIDPATGATLRSHAGATTPDRFAAFLQGKALK